MKVPEVQTAHNGWDKLNILCIAFMHKCSPLAVTCLVSKQGWLDSSVTRTWRNSRTFKPWTQSETTVNIRLISDVCFAVMPWLSGRREARGERQEACPLAVGAECVGRDEGGGRSSQSIHRGHNNYFRHNGRERAHTGRMTAGQPSNRRQKYD